LFISSGKNLRDGGPATLFLAFATVCTCVWAMLQTVSGKSVSFRNRHPKSEEPLKHSQWNLRHICCALTLDNSVVIFESSIPLTSSTIL
jgi:hypothetical protein